MEFPFSIFFPIIKRADKSSNSYPRYFVGLVGPSTRVWVSPSPVKRHKLRNFHPEGTQFFYKTDTLRLKKMRKEVSLSLSGKGPGHSLFSGACPMAILTHPWEKNIGQAVALPGMKYIGQCFLILGKNGVISSVVAPSLGMKPQLNEQKLFKIFLTNSMQTTLNRHTIFRWR